MMKAEIFGVDELQKAFDKMQNRYDNKVDALLAAQGKLALSRVKSKTPVGKTRKLKGSWRLKKVKRYGDTRVVRIQSTARHAHLVELGHELVRGGSSRRNGKKLGRIGRAVRGVRSVGYVEGREMLAETMRELESRYASGVQKLLDDLTKDVEI